MSMSRRLGNLLIPIIGFLSNKLPQSDLLVIILQFLLMICLKFGLFGL